MRRILGTIAVLLAAVQHAPAVTVEVVAGGGVAEGVPATEVEITATDVAADAAGNVYVPDNRNQRIRRVDAATGIVTTFAGNGRLSVREYIGPYGFCGDGGPAAESCFALGVPRLGLDGAGDVYVLDDGNERIRRIDAATGIITTVAGTGVVGVSGACDDSPDGGQATETCLRSPSDLAVAPDGDVYVLTGGRVRRVDAATGIIATVAGMSDEGCPTSGDGGPATLACLGFSWAIALDAGGNLYVVTYDGVRRIDATTHTIETIALGRSSGCDPDSAAFCLRAVDVAVDTDGTLVAVDGQARVRRLDPVTGAVTVVAGNGVWDPDYEQGSFCGDGGPAPDACLSNPVAVAIAASGDVLIADRDNERVRRVDHATNVITTVAGGRYGFCGEGGPATDACLLPTGLGLDAGDGLYVTDARHVVWRVTGGTLARVAGSGVEGFCGDGGPALDGCFDYPSDVALDSAGHAFVADLLNNRVRDLDLAAGTIDTLAGTGVYGSAGEGCWQDGVAARDACLMRPQGVAVAPGGNVLVADTDSNRVRVVDRASGLIGPVAGRGSFGFCGDGAAAPFACLFWPEKIAIDAGGNPLVADTANDRVRRVRSNDGRIETVAGGGPGIGVSHAYGTCGEGGPATAACLQHAESTAGDAFGAVFVADFDRLLRVDPVTARLERVVLPQSFYTLYPQDLAVDANGDLLVATLRGVVRIRFAEEGLRVGRIKVRDATGRRGRARMSARLEADESQALLAGMLASGAEVGVGRSFAARAGAPVALVRFPAESCSGGEDGVRCAQDGDSLRLRQHGRGGLDVRADIAVGAAVLPSGSALRIRLTIPGVGAYQDALGLPGGAGACRRRPREVRCRR